MESTTVYDLLLDESRALLQQLLHDANYLQLTYDNTLQGSEQLASEEQQDARRRAQVIVSQYILELSESHIEELRPELEQLTSKLEELRGNLHQFEFASDVAHTRFLEDVGEDRYFNIIQLMCKTRQELENRLEDMPPDTFMEFHRLYRVYSDQLVPKGLQLSLGIANLNSLMEQLHDMGPPETDHETRSDDEEEQRLWDLHDKIYGDYCKTRPRQQFETQVQDEKIRDWVLEWPSREAIDDVASSIVNKWSNQGIWLDRWSSHRTRSSERPWGPWRHENAQGDDKYYFRREARQTRPLLQFSYQVAELESDMRDVDPEPEDSASHAYEQVKRTWRRWGIWEDDWTILPGHSWRHEQPFHDYLVKRGFTRRQIKQLYKRAVDRSGGSISAFFLKQSLAFNHDQLAPLVARLLFHEQAPTTGRTLEDLWRVLDNDIEPPHVPTVGPLATPPYSSQRRIRCLMMGCLGRRVDAEGWAARGG